MTREGISIRPMTRADLAVVTEMEKAIFPDPWTASMFGDTMIGAGAVNLVAEEEDGSVCGYLCALTVADEIQIHNVAVHVSARRQGIGRALLEAAEQQGAGRGALCAILEVRATNTAALAMYGRMGYRRIGRRRAYYRKPVCDALVLLKVFDGVRAESNRQDVH
jgi:ribosomal-protein-alanine N-acetyltransferase